MINLLLKLIESITKLQFVSDVTLEAKSELECGHHLSTS